MPLFAASTASYDLALVLGSLLLIIAAARVGAEIAERLRVPAVLGEIVAGLLVGPSVLGWVDPARHSSVADMILLLGELGVILLLMQVGLEMDLGELGKVGATAVVVGVIGVVVPMGTGIAVAHAFGESGNVSLFLGAALTATSVGITARVLGDLRALTSVEARVVLGAAVADDVLGLVILTVVVKLVAEGSIGAGLVAETLGLALGFLVVTGLLAVFVVPRVLDRIHATSRSSNTVIVAAFGLTIATSLLANEAKLAFIIGAFVAGIGIGRSSQRERIGEGLHPLGHVFVPIFFASIGINADLGAMTKPKVLALAGCLTAVAIVGKLVAGLGVRSGRADRLSIGIGMVPRGEVGLIFASIGLANGILDEDLYASLVLVVLVTTLVTPPLLTARIRRTSATPDAIDVESVHEPAGGWIAVGDGRLTLDSAAPDALVLDLAMRAAELSIVAQPGDEMLDWFAARRTLPLQWRPVHTDRLITVLRDGGPPARKILGELGVLERALPEVAELIDRHRADPDLFDATYPLHLPLVDRIHELMASPNREPVFDALFQHLEYPELLTLAGFVHDVSLDESRSKSLTRRLRPSGAAVLTRSLNLCRALHLATRGPDLTLDDAIANIDDRQVLILGLLLALLTSSDVAHSAIVEAGRRVAHEF